jgi:hypothetical protein
MKAIFASLLTLSLVGCATTGHYYPDRASAPTHCKIRDGYCYLDHVVREPSGTATEVVDVYAWTPQAGWQFHYREVMNAASWWWWVLP